MNSNDIIYDSPFSACIDEYNSRMLIYLSWSQTLYFGGSCCWAPTRLVYRRIALQKPYQSILYYTKMTFWDYVTYLISHSNFISTYTRSCVHRLLKLKKKKPERPRVHSSKTECGMRALFPNTTAARVYPPRWSITIGDISCNIV